ncbi:MAG: glycosyltransferase [Dehalococcoidia bacterium]|nr:glycosyltransferase [Dehalococcoidia bacterium]
MDQLRIALLSSHSCPWAQPGNRYTGGMNIYIQNLARELAQRGHMVDIYTASRTGDEQCTAAKLTQGIQLLHIKAANFSTLSESNLDSHVSDIAGSILSRCRLYDYRYDIIHSHYWLSGLVGKVLQESWEIPHVTMFHTLARLKNMAGTSSLEPDFRIQYEQKVINSCNMIIASTSMEKQALLLEYGAIPDNISVIPCGIDPELFRPMDRSLARQSCKLDSKPTILFVGRMDPLKGLSNLLDAVAMLQPRHDFQLLIIGGDNENEAEYQRMLQLICNYKLSNVVFPLGSIPHNQMYRYYNAADFCVIPSYYESFSMVALESLACCTPILSTDVGEVKELVKMLEGCQIMVDNSPATIAVHIDNMLNSINNHKCCENSMLTTRYGWDKITENLISVYGNTLSSSNIFQRSIIHL